MKLSRDKIIAKLREILILTDDKYRDAVLNCDENTNLTTELGFSSISLLYMVIAIEEEFKIRFEDVGAADFVTLGDVVSYIEGKLS